MSMRIILPSIIPGVGTMTYRGLSTARRDRISGGLEMKGGLTFFPEEAIVLRRWAPIAAR